MFRDYLKLAGFRVSMFLAEKLPVPLLYWLAARAADLHRLLDASGRRAVGENLRRVLPEASEEHISGVTASMYRNFATYLAEFLGVGRFSGEFLDTHADIAGIEHLDGALRRGCGCICLSCHISNWEFGALLLARRGYAVNAIVQRHAVAATDAIFTERRRAAGVGVFSVEEGATASLRALRRNEIVCILGDRDLTSRGLMVDYFGVSVSFPRGPARLALATGAALVPCFVSRRDGDCFTLAILPELPVPETGPRRDRVRAVTERVAGFCEETVRRHPEEWAAFYRLGDRPPGARERQAPG